MSTATVKKIGAQLKRVRTEKGLTQSEVARKAGTNTNYYAKLERGETAPSLKMLEKVITALGTRSSNVLPF